MSKTIIIIGAGLAGLSAALQAAENGCNVKLVSSLPSERAQSVMAEGGINAALNTKDENDSPEEHFTDTIKAACGLADPNAVWGMTQAAPELVHWLLKLGVKFNMSGYDDVGSAEFWRAEKETDCFCTERYREADHDSYDRRCSQERSIWYGRTVQPSFFPNTSSVWQYLLWLRNQG